MRDAGLHRLRLGPCLGLDFGLRQQRLGQRPGCGRAQGVDGGTYIYTFVAALALRLREGLGANQIERVYGILNGTCNYILTTMEAEGRDFAEVLAEAQALGTYPISIVPDQDCCTLFTPKHPATRARQRREDELPERAAGVHHAARDAASLRRQHPGDRVQKDDARAPRIDESWLSSNFDTS